MELRDAKKLALELTPCMEAQWVRLEDGLGRVLAESIVADRDVPGEARSRLDGYALHSGDSAGASTSAQVLLRVKDRSLAAGRPLEGEDELAEGECARILTGAPIPPSADTVAAQERVVRRDGAVALTEPLKPGEGISPPGVDARKGDLLLREGLLLTPSRLAIAAALGMSGVKVRLMVRVALLATGDEVRELGESLDGPWTYCNGRHLLAWLVSAHGGLPVSLGVAGDDTEQIVELLRKADADVVITTGGIGRGDRDFILDAWRELGVSVAFREINLSPGKSSALGCKDGRTYWALPGNPWGAQLVFEELIRPALYRSMGLKECADWTIQAFLQEAIEQKQGMYRAIRGRLSLADESPKFFPMSPGSRSLFQTLAANFAYTLLEPHVIEVPAGSTVRVRLHDFPLMAAPAFYCTPTARA